MMSVSSGHSAEYLTGQVAKGRESYYLDATTAGEPPGRWSGSGAAAFRLQGEVDNDQMEALYARFLDPRDPRFWDAETRDRAGRLGQAPGKYRTTEEILAAKLAKEPDALPERVAELRREAETQTRQAVAFIDCTFSPPKSVTVLHTAYARAELDAQRAGDPAAAGQWAAKRVAVENAVWAGNQAMLGHLADQAGYSRTRSSGGATRWVAGHDWTVASFFQHDSRDHDPQLHIHNAVLNRVVCGDGEVRTLDSRAIHRNKQGAGTIGDRVMERELTKGLGVRWVMRADGKAREVEGVDQVAMDLFSERTAKITKRLDAKIRQFREQVGREPSALEVYRMHRQSVMATRQAKSHDGETRGEQLDRWADKLQAEVGGGLHRVANTVGKLPTERADQAGQVGDQVADTFSPSAVKAAAIAACQEARSTFGRSEVIRQVLLALPDNLATDQVARMAEQLADEALADADLVVRVTGAQPTRSVPEELVLDNGTQVYAAPGGPRFATEGHIAAEVRLRQAAVERGGYAVPKVDAERWLDTHRAGRSLKPDQREAVLGILTGGAKLSLMVGPAGTGKSYTLGVASAAWEDLTGGRMIGLATSQRATAVLAEDMAEARVRELQDDGVQAMNTARWLATQERLAAGRPHMRDLEWRLNGRDLVVLDEASMVDTAVWDEVRARVEQAGGRMVGAGDPRQLAAVGAGGAMEMLAAGQAETYTLTEVRRFHSPWEARASLQLRDGDPAALAEYDRRGRIVDSGTLESAGVAAARGYLADTLDGKSSLVVTATNEAAARVSAHIREQMVALGRVEEDGVILARDGNVAGVGDLVQARRNDWGADVVNRERYWVREIRGDGSMVLHRDGADEVETWTVTSDYVRDHLTLGYASTAHSAQGMTVDTCHGVVTAQLAPEGVYVTVTRGRESNTMYVATQPEVAGEETGETHGRQIRSAIAVVMDVLAKETEDEKAVLTQAGEDAAAARSMHTVTARYEDAVRQLGRIRTETWLDRLAGEGVISAAERERFAGDQATEQLSRLLRTCEQAGHDPEAVLRDAVSGRGLDGLASLAQGVHARITKTMEETPGSLAPKLDETAAMTPDGVPPAWADYLGKLAEVADERRRELGEETARAQPQWAVEALGPVPDDVVDRAEWTHRAGVVAAHREATAWEDPSVPIGPASGISSTERRASWHSAWTALGRPEAGEDEKALSEGQLRVRVSAWTRERQWAPDYVNDEMRATGQAVARHRQDAVLLQARAAAAEDPAERERLLDDAAGRAALAEELAVVEANLARVADDRAAWHVETAATRDAGERAWKELEARGLEPGAEMDRVTPEEWLAAHDEAMVAEDPHRPVSEVDAPDEVWDDEAGDLVQVVDAVEDAAEPERVEAPAVDNVVDAEVHEDRAEPVAEAPTTAEADVVDAELVEDEVVVDRAETPAAEPEPDVVDAEVVDDGQDKPEPAPVEGPRQREEILAGVPSVAETERAVAEAELAAEELANRASAERAEANARAARTALAVEEARESSQRAADEHAAEQARQATARAAEDAQRANDAADDADAMA